MKIDHQKLQDMWIESNQDIYGFATLIYAELLQASEPVALIETKVKELPRYSFLLNHGGVARFLDKSGAWIERHEVITLLENIKEASPPNTLSDGISEDKILAGINAQLEAKLLQAKLDKAREALEKIKAYDYSRIKTQHEIIHIAETALKEIE